MEWKDIRKIYPSQWLVIEALEAHTRDDRRILDRISVIETCVDGAAAFQGYQKWHHQHPFREFYYVNTSRPDLDIREKHWVGIRRSQESSFEIDFI